MGGEVWGWGSGGHPGEGVRGAQTKEPGPSISPPGFEGPVFLAHHPPPAPTPLHALLSSISCTRAGRLEAVGAL